MVWKLPCLPWCCCYCWLRCIIFCNDVFYKSDIIDFEILILVKLPFQVGQSLGILIFIIWKSHIFLSEWQWNLIVFLFCSRIQDFHKPHILLRHFSFFLASSEANFCKFFIVHVIQYFFNASFSYISLHLKVVSSQQH